MSQDFPNCSQCGAAPESRKSEYCRFCGAPLPWSEYDLRSRRTILVVPSNTLEDALRRVEESMEFKKATLSTASAQLRSKRQRRKRSRRERASKKASWAMDDDAHEGMLGLAVLLFPFAIGVVVRFAGSGLPQFVLVASVLIVLAIWGANRSSKTAERRWRRSIPKRRRLTAAGLIELDAPEPASRHDDSLVRKVTVQEPRGKKRQVIADVYMDLHAGDVGILETHGQRIKSFRRMDHVGAPSGTAPAK